MRSTHTHTLLKCIDAHPEDTKSTEYALSTLSHAVSAIAGDGNKPPNATVMRLIDMKEVFKAFTSATRVKEGEEKGVEPSYYLILHAISFSSSATLHFPEQVKAHPTLLSFIVATMRSADLIERCTSMGALIRVFHAERQLEYGQFDPMALIARIQCGYPKELNDVIMAYGPERAEITVIIKTVTDNQRAFIQVAQDKDLCALGRKLVELVMRTEMSLVQGGFQDEKGVTRNLGLPFTMWLDALPHCAKALREAWNREEDLACVLELKRLLLNGRHAEAYDIATRAVQRNPDYVYFWYAITKTSMHAESLRAAKRGLKCKSKGITSFLRFALLQAAVETATDFWG